MNSEDRCFIFTLTGCEKIYAVLSGKSGKASAVFAFAKLLNMAEGRPILQFADFEVSMAYVS
jgi:hypothetical protein